MKELPISNTDAGQTPLAWFCELFVIGTVSDIEYD
jgi:hypothetical protein